jgi:hypothetical protein
MTGLVAELGAGLAPHGLIVRGLFRPAAADLAGTDLRAADVSTLVLIGNAGAAMWRAFEPFIDGKPNPLDRWTRRIVDPLADHARARAMYPFDNPPPPIQRWAMRAERLRPSPLGILIHPLYGLWHAYRAVLVFPDGVESEPEANESIQQEAPAHPCDSCAEKPCLKTCPVSAFSGAGYDVPVCSRYLAGGDGGSCLRGGCQARNACPISREWRYGDAQTAFHMAAFARAVAPRAAPAND